MSWLDRWRRKSNFRSASDLLNGAHWQCRICDQRHQGMFDLGSLATDYWPYVREYEPNGALRFEGDFLSEDFCVLGGEDFFVRSVFYVPVHGVKNSLGFGVWSTLSRQNFELYVEHFDDDTGEKLGPWFGYFSNSLKGFPETVPEPCDVVPRSNRQRPALFLQNKMHELAIAQHDGISPERVLEIYTAYGHEIE